MRLAAHLSFILLLAAAGCGGSSTSPATNNNSSGNNPPPQSGPSTSNAITIGNNWFDPASTTVPVGTKVTWTWNSCGGDGYGGQTCVTHSVAFDDGQSSPSQSDGSFSRTFATAGTYKYHCAIHGASMSGTIVVQ
jgi:plastocyanin